MITLEHQYVEWLVKNPERLRKIARTHHWKTFQGANLYTHEDLIQDIILKLYLSPTPVKAESEEQFLSLVYRAMRNHITNVVVSLNTHKENQYRAIREMETWEGEDTLEETYSHQRALVEKNWNLLSPSQQRVLELHREGYKYGDIAKVENISFATAKMRVHAGKEVLRKHLCSK